MFQGDVEEVGSAAGRIEHLDGAEVAVEGGDEFEGLGVFLFGIGAEFLGGGTGFLGIGGVSGGEELFRLVLQGIGTVLGGFGLVVERGGGESGGFPFLAQRLDDGRADEALDVGARRVFRAKFVALPGIQGAGEQGAEDGGFHAGPVGVRSFREHFKLGGGEREGGGVFEEAAIEAGDFLEKQGRVTGASGHFPPEGGDEHGEAFRGGFDLGEEFFESILRQQADVFGKHGEEAALEETGDDLGVVAVGFEGLRELGKAVGDVAGDLGGFLGGIERVGIGEDEA